jgi:hypothetical protein
MRKKTDCTGMLFCHRQLIWWAIPGDKQLEVLILAIFTTFSLAKNAYV